MKDAISNHEEAFPTRSSRPARRTLETAGPSGRAVSTAPGRNRKEMS